MTARRDPWPRHTVTATITLAGPQHPTITTHGDGGSGSLILVQVGGCLLQMHDRSAARVYQETWCQWEAHAFRDQLPATRELAHIPAGASPALVVEAHGADTTKVWLEHDHTLLIRIGRLTWAVADRAAYDQVADTLTTVRALARIILPRPH